MRRFLEETSTGSETEHASSEGEEEAEFGEYISFGVIPLAMTLGVLTRFTLAKWLPLPYTVLLLLWGCVFGAIYTELENPFNAALDNGIGSWLGMDPRMLQVVFFPILIFASAFNAQFHILERRLGQIIFLALPGVILGATLTAVFIKVVLPYDWEWELCFVFGSMVAATDPVAVVALLEELGVSEKLGTLIEGESLLNDGSAIVVFEVFIEAIEGTDRNWLEIIGFGARLALGGPAIGAVIGVAGAFFLGYVINDALIEVSVTLILAYSTFALCEATAVKVSGVLGIVACGVMMSYYGKPRVSSTVLPSLMDFWKTLQFFADTIIFFLSGLIVVGVAVNDRSIDGEDFGYLLALFVALYIIRGIVVLFAYPILRSGEYKITIPQMFVLTHSGLRGAVALILALVVDGVHEIELEQRDKIVFLTAGVAVLSLLFNGTTTGPLVRFLKLDRASEAAESVFSNACFALELSMEEQQRMLQEDPFLCDANWSLVWRYIPLFTADSYWHRLSKGHITPSSEEAEDIRDANSSTCRRNLGPFESFMEWVYDMAGLYYKALPHRLRSPWFAFHKTFLFDDAGGESVWGPLDAFLAMAQNRSTSQDSDVWSGHLKHSVHGGRTFWTAASEHTGFGHASAADAAAAAAATAAEDTDADSEENAEAKRMIQGVEEEKTSKTGGSHVVFKIFPGDEPKEEGGVHVAFEEDIQPDKAPSPGEGTLRRSESKRLFQRATSMVRAAGIDVSLTEKEEAEGELDKSALMEARLRFLCALKAEYFKAKREGKLGSSGLRVLTEAMNYAHDRVEKGCVLDGWSDLRSHFSPGWEMIAATYMNWWPARPLVAAAIARHVSFQMELAWNFLEAHQESNVKSILEGNGEISRVQREVNLENQKQINHAEDTIARLTISSPMVTRSVKTRTVARVMIKRFREAVEHLAENGHLDEKEEEVLITAATEGEMRIAYHPNLEQLPPLPLVLEKIEFLAELTSEEREKLIESGAATYQEYVGEVRLIEIGKMGTSGVKKGGEGDLCCWFYVVRGQVEKSRMAEDGGTEFGTHSSGILFGITDSMLEIPHHAGYTTNGFSNLVVFDRAKLLELAGTMPSLDESLWKTVAAHCLRRNIRFHKFALQSCHSLLDNATFLRGRSGREAEEMITMEANDLIVLVRGRMISLEGRVIVTALGRPDTSVAPVLLEPIAGGEGGTLKVSGDYKMFKMASDLLTNFSREEKGRMSKRESMKRATMSLSAFSEKEIVEFPAADEDEAAVTPGPARGDALRGTMQREMASNFNLHPRAASVGVKAAMKLMAGVRSTQDETGDDVDNDGVWRVAEAEEWEGEEGEEERLTQGGAKEKWHALSALARRKNREDDE